MGNLVLERRIGESLYLSVGDVSICVKILSVGHAIKLAIVAPLSVTITRGECVGVKPDTKADLARIEGGAL